LARRLEAPADLVGQATEAVDHPLGDERRLRHQPVAVLLGGGDLGHEHPQVALQADEDLVELAAAGHLGPGHAERGLGLVDGADRVEAGGVLGLAAAVEQAGGAVVPLAGPEASHRWHGSAAAAHHVSMWGRFLPVRGAVGAAAKALAIQRRESAGSITSSISKWLAELIALPCSYMRSTISRNVRSRSSGSSIASSSLR